MHSTRLNLRRHLLHRWCLQRVLRQTHDSTTCFHDTLVRLLACLACWMTPRRHPATYVKPLLSVSLWQSTPSIMPASCHTVSGPTSPSLPEVLYGCQHCCQ